MNGARETHTSETNNDPPPPPPEKYITNNEENILPKGQQDEEARTTKQQDAYSTELRRQSDGKLVSPGAGVIPLCGEIYASQALNIDDKLIKREKRIKAKEKTDPPVNNSTADCLKEAMNQTLNKMPPHINNKELSRRTIDLISERQAARDELNREKIELHKQVRKSIRKDKKDKLIEQLDTGEWEPIKKTRKGFIPKHTKLTHPGRIATSDERPDILADYFEKKQWGNKITEQDRENISRNMRTSYINHKLYDTEAKIRTCHYDIKELIAVIKAFRKNKRPGPDEPPAHFVKIPRR